MTSVVERGHCSTHRRGTAHGPLTGGLVRSSTGVTPHVGPGLDIEEARAFVDQCYAEKAPDVSRATRWQEIRDEIATTGTYTHTVHELEFGARVAWRNSARCIGRLYWKSLRVRDLRHLRAPEDVARECVTHLRESTRAAASGRRSRSSPPTARLVRGRGSTTTSSSATPGTACRRARCAATAARRLHRQRAGRRLAAARAPRSLRRAAADDLRRRGAGTVRDSARRRPRGRPRPPEPGVVHRAAAALARPAGDQQHAAARRRRHLSRGSVQRLVPRTPRSALATSPTPTGTTCCR